MSERDIDLSALNDKYSKWHMRGIALTKDCEACPFMVTIGDDQTCQWGITNKLLEATPKPKRCGKSAFKSPRLHNRRLVFVDKGKHIVGSSMVRAHPQNTAESERR